MLINFEKLIRFMKSDHVSPGCIPRPPIIIDPFIFEQQIHLFQVSIAPIVSHIDVITLSSWKNVVYKFVTKSNYKR
jgi:hypothetical protein